MKRSGREGLLSEPDMASLRAYRRILDDMFRANLVAKKPKLTDGKLGAFLVLPTDKPLTIDLTFDRISIQENITDGQRITSGRVAYRTATVISTGILYTARLFSPVR